MSFIYTLKELEDEPVLVAKKRHLASIGVIDIPDIRPVTYNGETYYYIHGTEEIFGSQVKDKEVLHHVLRTVRVSYGINLKNEMHIIYWHKPGESEPLGCFRCDKPATFIQSGFRRYLVVGEPYFDRGSRFVIVHAINEDGVLFRLIWNKVSRNVIRENWKFWKFVESLDYSGLECLEYDMAYLRGEWPLRDALREEMKAPVSFEVKASLFEELADMFYPKEPEKHRQPADVSCGHGLSLDGIDLEESDINLYDEIDTYTEEELWDIKRTKSGYISDCNDYNDVDDWI